jgi:hypothetical protein
MAAVLMTFFYAYDIVKSGFFVIVFKHGWDSWYVLCYSGYFTAVSVTSKGQNYVVVVL